MLLQFFKKKGRRSLVIFPQKVWRVRKHYFSFLKAAKGNRCQIIVHGKVVNQNDGLGIKVPSQMLFAAEEKFIHILKERFPKLL